MEQVSVSGLGFNFSLNLQCIQGIIYQLIISFDYMRTCSLRQKFVQYCLLFLNRRLLLWWRRGSTWSSHSRTLDTFWNRHAKDAKSAFLQINSEMFLVWSFGLILIKRLGLSPPDGERPSHKQPCAASSHWVGGDSGIWPKAEGSLWFRVHRHQKPGQQLLPQHHYASALQYPWVPESVSAHWCLELLFCLFSCSDCAFVFGMTTLH